MISLAYRSQVELLLMVLPFVAKENIFALKGGTAINLFERDLPRLSVDIDLTYTRIDSRDLALRNINDALLNIKKAIENTYSDIHVIAVPKGEGVDVKLHCQSKKAQIKIEVNTVTRGILFPSRLMQVSESVQTTFNKFAAISVVSHEELFGGKMCAAIDRQHPRDIFDMKLLLEQEGLTPKVLHGFLFMLLSHYKPIHELLSPKLKDQQSAFDSQFKGMTFIDFSYSDYSNCRTQLFDLIKKSFSDDEKNFIISFENGEPNWELFPENISIFPAIQWKLQNIQLLKKENPSKQTIYMNELKRILE